MTLNAVQALDPAAVAAGFGDLPTLAPVAVEVLRLADDDTASLEDIAAVISNDPGLAAQMLKVANSPMYGMGGEVASLNRAASILGLRTVKLLSLSFAVVASTGGDASDACIAAASIVAKVHRDALMCRLHRRYPGYGFDRHKGYATRQHLDALRRLGPSPLHRCSFSPVSQLELL